MQRAAGVCHIRAVFADKADLWNHFERDAGYNIITRVSPGDLSRALLRTLHSDPLVGRRFPLSLSYFSLYFAYRSLSFYAIMAPSSDVVVLAIGIVLAAVYLFRDAIFAATKPKAVPVPSSKSAAGGGNPRDFIAKMKEGVRFSVSASSQSILANA